MKLSAVVLAKNEEGNIKDCLGTLSFCDEVIVVNDDSVDDTCRVAKSHGAKVFTRSLGGDFSTQRNFALEKAKGEWVLFVDADERVSKNLATEIEKVIEGGMYDGFYLRRDDYFLGKKLKRGETALVKLLRLGKRKKGKWTRKVHEVWQIDGKIGLLTNSLDHYSHLTLGEFIEEINWMSTLHAQENQREKKRLLVFKIVSFPVFKFVSNYFLKFGVFDRVYGFVFAMAMSFHSFLAWSKLWLIQRGKK